LILGTLLGTFISKNGKEIRSTKTENIMCTASATFTLLSIPVMLKKGWKLIGTKKMMTLTKRRNVIEFNIIVTTIKGILFCLHVKRHTFGEVGVKVTTRIRA
jgi:hypothetical protein